MAHLTAFNIHAVIDGLSMHNRLSRDYIDMKMQMDTYLDHLFAGMRRKTSLKHINKTYDRNLKTERLNNSSPARKNKKKKEP